jgi:hypothetical protein
VKKRLPKWRFFLPSALLAVVALSYLFSREWGVAFLWLAVASLWAVTGWTLWQKQEKG